MIADSEVVALEDWSAGTPIAGVLKTGASTLVSGTNIAAGVGSSRTELVGSGI